MPEKNIDDIINALTVLFSKLGIVGEQAFNYLIKYTTISGFSKLFFVG